MWCPHYPKGWAISILNSSTADAEPVDDATIDRGANAWHSPVLDPVDPGLQPKEAITLYGAATAAPDSLNGPFFTNTSSSIPWRGHEAAIGQLSRCAGNSTSQGDTTTATKATSTAAVTMVDMIHSGLVSHLGEAATAVDVHLSHLGEAATAVDVHLSHLGAAATAVDVHLSHLGAAATAVDVHLSHLGAGDTAVD